MQIVVILIVVAVAVAVVFAFFGIGGFNLFGLAPQQTQSPTQAFLSQVQQQSGGITQLVGEDVTVGTGTPVAPGDMVSVNYTGMLTDGTVFDASSDHGGPFSFTVGAGQVIQGWDQGLLGMQVGGERLLAIPASLAYGANAVGSIPANSTLIFDIQLLSITPAGSSTPATSPSFSTSTAQ